MSSVQFEHIRRIRKDFHVGSKRLKSSSNNSIRTLADDLYNKHTHFIFELIQNAEDNTYESENTYPPYISFRLTKIDPTASAGSDGALIIQNNETGFNSDNVDAICAVGATTKEKGQGYIGEKGIGFKSVFRITDNPHIFSNGYHFCLPESDEETGLGYIVPQWIDTPPEGLDLSETHIILPLIKKDFGYEEIEKMLQDIEPEIILFLSTLQEIQIKTDTGNDFTILKDDSAIPEVQIVAEGKKQGLTFSNSDKFLVCTGRFDKPADIHHEKREGIESRDVKIAVPLDENSTAIGKIFAYLPVRSGTGFPFLINADFILPSSREDIQDVPWNRNWLMDCVADLISKELLPLLKEQKFLNIGFLEALAGELNNLAKDENNLFYPIFSRLRETFMNEELLPTNDETFISARNAKLADSEGLIELLNSDQLSLLFERSGITKWLLSDITVRRTQNLWKYLRDELKIDEVDPEMFARRLSESFLAEQSDNWFVRFYKFLSIGARPPISIWKPPKSLLRTRPILRLQDGTHINPSQERSFPTAYLSVGRSADISLPIVKWEISQDEDAYNFLKALGVQECDVVAEVIETVLPKYELEFLKVSIDEHLRDFAKIERAYKTDSREKKAQLKKVLQETPFIRAEKPNEDGIVYFKPDQIYFNSDALRLYFEGSPSNAFINLGIYPTSAPELFTDLGSVDFVRIKRKEKNRQGYVTIVDQRGFHQRGLDGFDLLIQVDGLEHALDNPTPAKSAFIWNYIAVPNADCICGIIQKSTTQTYSNSSFEDVISYYFGDYLIDRAWLPDFDGNMHKPSEITLDGLPDSFKNDKRLAEELKMPISKARIIDIVASEIGVSSDILNRIIDASPETIEQIESLLQSDFDLSPLSSSPSSDSRPMLSSQPTSFPVGTVSNPTRRAERILEELKNAPDQEYAEKLRSVRTTRNAIDPKTWLSTQYTNDDNQMVCQICQDEMPFKHRDGNYYFDAVEMLKGHFTKEYEAQFLALCLECSAKYKTSVKQVPEAMDTLKKQLMASDNSGDFEVPLKLDDQDTSLRFVERHWLDIKAILSFYEQQSEESVETEVPDEKHPKTEKVPDSQPKVAEPITDHMIEVGLEAVTVESLTGIKEFSESAAKRVVGAIEIHNELSKTSARKTSEPKPSTAEKFREANTLDDRVEIGCQVAELRINAAGSKPMSWARIRAKLDLKNDEFHKVVRLESHFHESVVERIESFEDGWEYNGKLEVLLGFEPVGELANRIEACKPKPAPKVEPKEEVKVEQPIEKKIIGMLT